jgi:Double-GTPase 2
LRLGTLGTLGTLYCPYCYEEISARQIWFRCTGRISRSGRRCAPEADPVLRARTGFTEALPPPFAGDGRQGSARCPGCGDDTTIRICPVCHSRLPVHFGNVPSRLIVPVGAKEAGKTVFMTVLVHELMHQTGQRLNAAITGADDSTRERFTRDYERPMYRDSKLLAPTTPGAPHQAPLVFRFTTEGRPGAGALARLAGRPGRGEPQRTLLSFFDTAGEDLRSARSMERSVRYLGAADGILLLLDPLQMPGARALASAGTRLPTPGSTDDEPANVLENVTDLIMAAQVKKPNERISKPLAIVFTKMDALLDDLKDTSPLLRPPPQTSYFDDRDSLAVHTEMQRLLARWNGSRIDQIAQLNFSRYRYFGVSALGESPTADNRVSGRGIRPYRVTSPILWILAQFGIIGGK